MNQEILNLIEMAIADGVVSEKERSIILRKAGTLGEDKDEVEMILDGKLAIMKKQERPAVEKAGNVIKCPQCKEVVSSFTTKCESCGHEFRNVDVASSVKTFFEKLEKLEHSRQDDNKSGGFMANSIFGKALSGDKLEADKISKQKAELIASFPIPNAKEDILEFLALAVPRAKNIKSGMAEMWSGKQDQSEQIVAKAFKQKCEQIIMKAGFSFKNDESTLNEIRYYADDLKIKMK